MFKLATIRYPVYPVSGKLLSGKVVSGTSLNNTVTLILKPNIWMFNDSLSGTAAKPKGELTFKPEI